MSEENVEIVRRLYDFYRRGSFKEAITFYDPTIEYVRVGSEVPDFAGSWQGVEGMRTAVMGYLNSWETYRYDPQEIRDLDDRVLVRERHVGRGKRSGIEVDHDVGALFTLRDGRVVRFAQYWNFSDALEAAGLSE